MMFIVIIIVFIVFVIAFGSKKPPSYLKGESPKMLSVDLNFKESVLDLNYAEIVVLDVETTGLPKNYDAKPEDLSNWPFVVQFSWAIFDIHGNLIKLKTHIIKPRIPIPEVVVKIHHISTEIANTKGIDPVKAFAEFISDIKSARTVVAHNIDFDLPILEAEFLRNGFAKQFEGKDKICTMKSSTTYCNIPKYNGRGSKYPKLTELFGVLFANNYNVSIAEAHDAENDTLMTAKCFFRLKERIELKVTKGKINFKSEIKPLIYDPDNNFFPKPVFKRISKKNCTDQVLLEKHEYYKKLVLKDWKRLYEESDTKIGSYGLDRLGYQSRLQSSLTKLNEVTSEIESIAI